MTRSSVTIRIPTQLRDCCAGASKLVLDAATPREVLEQLGQRHPELLRSICDETGSVRRHIGLFVNSDLVQGRGLDKELSPGDVVSIFPAVSGG